MSEALGDASALKLAANSWVASLCAATAQAMRLTQAHGLDPRMFLSAIEGGAADSAYAQAKGAVMAERGWDDPAFALDSAVKDIGLMVEAAGRSGFPDELLVTLLALYQRAADAGLGGADMSAVRAAFDR